jgi:hypothetical protein
MTYKELKDSIIARYKMDALLRSVPYIDLQEAWIFQLITQAEADIQRRTLASTLTLTADIGTDHASPMPNNGAVGEAEQYWVLFPFDQITTSISGLDDLRQGYNAILYGLPKDCGKIRQIITSEQEELEYKTPEDFTKLTDRSGKYYTLLWDGDIKVFQMYPVPTSVSMTFVYYKAILPFIDNNLTEGSDIQLPPEYYTAIEYKVMSNIFRDYIDLYEQIIRDLKEYQNNTPYNQLMGELGD